MVEWLIYSPDTTYSERGVLAPAAPVAIVEALYRCAIVTVVSTTPIVIRETAEFGLVHVELVQFCFRRQVPAAAKAGAVLLRLTPRHLPRIAENLQVLHVVGALLADFPA